MSSSRDKWVMRAEKYLDLYRTKGHAAATDYLIRFGDKSEKVIDALRDIREMKEEMEEEYQGQMRLLKKAVKKENEILGPGSSIDRIPDMERE